ncbi:YrbL family protein [Cloacibacillus porcorum]|uniref:PhoP regulatory network protein YrbL n=1 Tax=Cloacibacillus porcorum TaxID=1197717 RepID=A0A1B2I3Q6_9BACT|nr:YrbL family protein [Cloacibacillus porcorum]ANZ44599.1 hypothetical protein BED41_05545 [Cloacibacillus porcorum]
MLYLKELIGSGSVRDCYLQPCDQNKCVKVVKKQSNLPELEREIKIAKLVYPFLKEFIVDYEDSLTDTNKGAGLVCGLVKNDDDGLPAQPLIKYLHSGGNITDIKDEIDNLMSTIISCGLFFYDFNWGNFVVRNCEKAKRFFFIDLKGLHKNGYLGYLKMERSIAPLARIIMFRRIRRFYREIGLTFPFEILCREKMFSSVLVKVRLR